MSKDFFDKYIEKIQSEIIEEAIERYNKYIVELIQNPKNWGKPNSSETNTWYTYEGPCGDTMQFFLRIENDKIKKANFITDGCGATVAAGSQTTVLIEGKSIEFAQSLKPSDIDKALGGLPNGHKHCAELAIRTLNGAIEKYLMQHIR
ncbi:MAG: iron-sulfur cluster assembly scaffold protein [Promethearchaeota archaeon]